MEDGGWRMEAEEGRNEMKSKSIPPPINPYNLNASNTVYVNMYIRSNICIHIAIFIPAER